MPVLDTVVLFAVADKEDKYHSTALKHMRGLSEEDYWVAGFALFEFDVVMKTRGLSFEERMRSYALMIRDFPHVAEKTLNLSPESLYLTARIEKEHEMEYFDAGIASESLQKDGMVVTTDRAFDSVPNLKRIW